MIRITEIRIHLLDEEDTNLKAYANVTFDDCFVVHGIKIIQGEKGLFIGMPRRKRQDGKSQDIAHPINSETRHFMESKVIEAYDAARKQAKAEVHPVL
jgi:stage V sporulation protein G